MAPVAVYGRRHVLSNAAASVGKKINLSSAD